MGKTCGYCKMDVDISVAPHIHDPKKCRSCSRSLPAAQFPLHPSAADGRRLECADCIRKQKWRQKKQNVADWETSRRTRNARFLKNGYSWVVRSPDGRHLSPAQAERELDCLSGSDEDDTRFDYGQFPY